MSWNDRRPPQPGRTFAISFDARERKPRTGPLPNQEPEPLEEEEIEEESTAWDEADALEAISDADFYSLLRGDIDRVRSGELPSGGEVEAAADARRPKDRPWSPRRKARDRYGRPL